MFFNARKVYGIFFALFESPSRDTIKTCGKCGCMVKIQLKKVYKNEYAYIYIADKINLFNNYYQLVFIGRIEDGCIYDTIILPPDKYKQDKQMFVIFHGDDLPEVFHRVY